MTAYLTPTCPGCGAPPLMGLVLGDGTQALCSGGDDCPVFTWDPSVSAFENLSNARTISIDETSDPS